MRTIRLVDCSLIVSSALLSGCIVTLGPRDENGESEDGKTSLPPDPKDPDGEEPVPDAAKQARKEECDRYITEVIYKGAPIIDSIRLPSGDTVDGVDRNALPPLPYAPPPLPEGLEETTLPPGVELGLIDVEQYAELRDLVTTAATFDRPEFQSYILGETDATSIEDYLDRYQEGGNPSDNQRLYAGLVSQEPNRGVSGFMNQFRPNVEQGTFSLLEFSVACPAPADGPVQEQIGIVISVDKRNAVGKGGEPRMHIEYARANPNGGEPKYVWDGTDGNFVANPFRRYRPGQIVPVSALGGTQVEHLMAIFQVPTGDWWIAYRGELLGYYPASLFTMLNGPACRSSWYGEVFKERKKTTTTTDMGSGMFAEAGFLYTASVRNPKYYDPLWFGMEPTDVYRMTPYVPSCYSRTALKKDVASGDSVLFLGGPGGKEPACTWPSP